MPSNARIAILLCTYNGTKFLQEQLDSFTHQFLNSWQLFVYDDASIDNTCNLIKQYQKTVQQTVILQSNPSSKGFAKNFLFAICTTPNDSADFFALSDQDDIWQKDKLSMATDYLEMIPAEVPALYCSRTQTIDAQEQPLSYSPLFQRTPSFKNALVQCIAGGNTIVFNKAAKILITQASQNIDVISHDWWIYLLITAAGGHVFYDPQPRVLYRQHGNNTIGANNYFSAKIARLKLLLDNSFKKWIDQNIAALNSCRDLLDKEKLKTLDAFIAGRQQSFFKRCFQLNHLRIYRQTFLSNIALTISIALNKI
jgi:glycosyltransferase involved in cell wall biosynthesis